MTTRVALYSRVSTDEQAEHGYSLEGQRRDLLAHALREGWSVVEEMVDDGHSGADPFRPGLRRVMELAREGSVDLVLAAKRDRLFRDRLHRLVFERDLREFGVKLVSLNDTGHEIGDGVLDDFAAWERKEIASRLHGGIRNMVMDGKVKAVGKPPYGYRLNDKALEVFEPEMENVRAIYAMSADGKTLGYIRGRLDEEGVRSPGNSPNGWGKKSVSDILKNDLYAPHGFEEVSTLVSEKVAATLDPEAVYGLWVWNRRKAKKWKEWSSEKNKFVTHWSYTERPKAEWVFVPVQDAGIEPEVVESARENPGGRRWMPTEGGVRQRFWELRGIAKCASCGSTLSPHAPNRRNLYYTCLRRHNANRKHCENHRYYPAEKLERAVLDTMRDLLDKREYFLERFEAHATGERRKLLSLATAGSAASWSRELDKIESRRDGFLELAADGVIPRDELRRKLSTVDAERDRLRAGLDAARTYANDATELEVHLSKTRELIKDASTDWLDSRASGEHRADMYRRLRLRVEVDGEDNMRLEGVFGVRSVWVNATHSRMIDRDEPRPFGIAMGH